VDAVLAQVSVVDLNELPCFVTVGPNYRVDGLAEELQKPLVVGVRYVESAVREDPVVVPVGRVVDAVLIDVASGVLEAGVGRAPARQVPDPP
jgi:hypothetical protein